MRILFAVALLALNANAIRFASNSDSDSCDSDSDSHEGHHHHGGGGGNRGCPDGWQRFERPNGGWCLRVYPSSMIDYSVAADNCARNRAEMSGIQNSNERDWIAENGAKVIGAPSGSIWIGAKRTNNCLGKLRSAECTQTLKEYTRGARSGPVAGPPAAR
uniref:C-type lectin domain-containing protein n=1 Tax=Caenorhabditis japonica TaxID=281687 RepID=A0A8R1HIS3_CAEJA